MVPGGDDWTTVFCELYALNTGAQSFSPVSVTVTCTRHRYVTALTAKNKKTCSCHGRLAVAVHGQDNISVSEYVYTVHLQPRRYDAQ